MTQPTEQPMDETSASDLARSIYADFVVWTAKTKPKWHPIKKMRYVFFRMIGGVTITDALKEIRWNSSEFWHLLDLKRNDPFRMEYQRAKRLQARAMADSVLQIAEGRDVTTKRSLAKIRKLIKRALRRAVKQKSGLAARTIVERLMSELNENDARIIARNKIQIDAAKWMAKAANPNEFGEKSSLSLNGGLGENAEDETAPILIQFVAPDGTVVNPA
jgi:hypothetical protein